MIDRGCSLTPCTRPLSPRKVSSVELERAIAEGLGPSVVADVAAVGVPSPGGGPELLVVFLVIKQLASDDGEARRQAMLSTEALLEACQREVGVVLLATSPAL